MYIAMKKLQETLYSSPYYLTEPKKPGGKAIRKLADTFCLSFLMALETYD